MVSMSSTPYQVIKQNNPQCVYDGLFFEVNVFKILDSKAVDPLDLDHH